MTEASRRRLHPAAVPCKMSPLHSFVAPEVATGDVEPGAEKGSRWETGTVAPL
jgi:hypothetical protein